MIGADHMRLARDMYHAYASGNRADIESLVSDDFMFFSPADVGIDRQRYFERCWPNSEQIDDFHFERLTDLGDVVLVTYEATRSDGSRFRNTEILTFARGKLCKAEVYFGWNL